jgi:hypothetical protein
LRSTFSSPGDFFFSRIGRSGLPCSEVGMILAIAFAQKVAKS